MKRLELLAVLLIGCEIPPETGMTAEALTGSLGCADVTAFGATPDDGTDDRAAIQAAIDAALASGPPASCTGGRCSRAVCFPAGSFHIDRHPSPTEHASIRIENTTDLSFFGVGPSSMLVMQTAGSTGHCTSQTSLVGAWFGFHFLNGVRGIRFRDLTMKAGLIDVFNEQTIFVLLGKEVVAAGVDDVSFQNVHFEDSCGDALYMIGGPGATATSDVRVLDSRFVGSLRRNIVAKTGVNRAQYIGNYFESHSHAINYDITPGVSAGAIVADNLFVKTSSVSGAAHLAFIATRDLVVRNNVLIHGGIAGVNLSGKTTIANNIVIGSPNITFQDPDLLFKKNIVDLHVTGNLLARTSSAPGPVLSVAYQDTAPKSASIRNNAIIQSTDSTAIHLHAVKAVEVIDNSIDFTRPGTAVNSQGVYLDSVATRVDHILVSGNRINAGAGGGSGAANTHGVLVVVDRCTAANCDTLDVDIASVAIRNNVISRFAEGVEFDDSDVSGRFLSPPLIANNTFDQVGIDIDGLGDLGMPYAIGGNLGGPRQFAGNGAPQSSFTPPNGSIYVRRDGLAGSTLFVRQSGVWVGK
jgi:hypothetical protein